MTMMLNNEKARLQRMLHAWDLMAEMKTDQCMDARDEKTFDEFIGHIRNVIPLENDITLLDLCCGNGRLSNRLALEAGKVFAMDYSSKMVNIGKDYAIDKEVRNINFFIGLADSLPFKDNAFDAVLCLGALYYLPSEESAKKAVREMVRVTREGGRILITDLPRKHSFAYNLWNVIRNRRTDLDYEIPLQAELSFRERVRRRAALLARMILGKRVISDGWLWLAPGFFNEFAGDKFKKVDTFRSRTTAKGLIGYKFDVLLSADDEEDIYYGPRL